MRLIEVTKDQLGTEIEVDLRPHSPQLIHFASSSVSLNGNASSGKQMDIDVDVNTAVCAKYTTLEYIVLYPFEEQKITISINESSANADADVDGDTKPNTTKCKNCERRIPVASFVLHELHCTRNIIKCKQCSAIVPRDTNLAFSSPPASTHHGTFTCDQCKTHEFENYFEMIIHQHTSCALKLHICRFCHLSVPQGEADYVDKTLGLSHHETECGGRTDICPTCNNRVRLKDFANHLQLHKLELPKTFKMCANEQCVNEVAANGNSGSSGAHVLQLCDTCYGPLHEWREDPQHRLLQNRLERRYFLQLATGCGNLYCNNPYCRMNLKNGATSVSSPSTKEVMKQVLLLMQKVKYPQLPMNKSLETNEGNGNDNWFSFCVNSESMARKKILFDMLLSEGEYEKSIILQALKQAGDNEGSVRDWLFNNAEKKR